MSGIDAAKVRAARLDRPLTIALAGNPNAGKSTIFNRLTGERVAMGNYPGVTVECCEGRHVCGGLKLRVVDLPGTYSLTAYSAEELAARDFLVDTSPDAVIDIVDMSNLERNLYLAVQIIELGLPVALAFNKRDEATRRGYRIDVEKLSGLLGVPIVETVGIDGTGLDDLIAKAAEVAAAGQRPVSKVRYGREIEDELAALAALIEGDGGLEGFQTPRWVALKLIESDAEVVSRVERTARDRGRIITAAESSRGHLRQIFGEEPELVVADRRYGFISGACTEAVENTVEARHRRSDRIDEVLTHPLFGLPIFAGLMWVLFQLVFRVGNPAAELLENGFAWLGDSLSAWMAPGLLHSLIADGIIGGVGEVLVFVPNIMLLFLGIAFLEDTGYMARAAFVMDRVMHRLGLHGKSFIPMLIGMGCTVPAVMATRILESRRDRIVTMLITPMVSCSAKLPVYTLLAAAFFAPEKAGNVIFSLYLLGLALAVLMAKIFRRWLLPGESNPFVMELPPYRVPTAKGLIVHMLDRGLIYVKKAGTVILAFSVLVWFASSFPRSGEIDARYQTMIESAEDEDSAEALENELASLQLRHSLAGRLGASAAYFLRPIGLGDWKIGTALVAGVGAKELVVSTLGTLYQAGSDGGNETSLRSAIAGDPFFTPLIGYVLMVFVLTYIPCVATLAVMRSETGTLRWPAFALVYTTGLAWIVAGIVYWGGTFLLPILG